MKNIDENGHWEFSRIYSAYFPKMVRFAQEYVISPEDAQNIVQDIFLYLWERHETLEAISNPVAFLFTLTKNRCIDFYRHKSRLDRLKESLDELQVRELNLKMQALQQFDENFFSSEDEEITRQLNVSVHTVQNHKGSDFELYDDDFIRLVQNKINRRPREKLTFQIPSKIFYVSLD